MGDYPLSFCAKVIHTVSAVSEEASGPTYSIVRGCDSLIEQGQEVTLAALDWAPLSSAIPFLKTFPLGIGPSKLGRSPELHRWLNERAASRTVDVIHNHGLWMMPNVYPGLVARQQGIPLVVSPRGCLAPHAMRSGSAVKRLFWPLVQRPALAATSCFHATAESEYQDIRRMGFREPVAIIPNGIDIPRLDPKEHGVLRTLLFLGRIHPIKGLDMLLPAWKAVQAHFPGWQLRIVGPDNRGYRDKVTRLAEQLHLERVEFAGPLYGDNKFKAYRQADLFVLPSYTENFGVAVAEALASGTPTIVTKGAPWAGLKPLGAGWWVDTNAEALAECLKEALSQSPAHLEEMGRKGREWMMNDYSWQGVGQQFSTLYRWLVQGGDAPAFIRLD